MNTALIILLATGVQCLVMTVVLLSVILTILVMRRGEHRLHSFAIPKVAYGDVWHTIKEYGGDGCDFEIVPGDAGLCTVIIKKAV